MSAFDPKRTLAGQHFLHCKLTVARFPQSDRGLGPLQLFVRIIQWTS